MEISGDEIADVVLRQFDAWESKRKPLKRTNGVREWVPLSGIVAQRQGSKDFTCLAMATGMKCLPQKSIARANGVVLHDWHAEILAIRSFNRFLLEECHYLTASQKKSSAYIRVRDDAERTESNFQPFALHDGINIHMYCSEAPCGDASMELTMASQEDSTPWAMPIETTPSSPLGHFSTPSQTTEPTSLHGRGYFSQLGVVRRKPSRPDAPPTLTKSCTDKIALKQSTSLLSSLTSLLISPENVYIHSLVLPSSQLSPVAANRSFSSAGRLKPLSGRVWEGGYAFKPFRVISTEREFEFSRRQVGRKELVSSNISSYWTRYGSETIIGGTLQGRKQFDIKGASRVCKWHMWRLALDVAALASMPAVERLLRMERYSDVKRGELLDKRRRVKEDVRGVLKGWIRNEGGEGFMIDEVER